MKPFVVLISLTIALLALPVQGAQYLTEAEKELLLEKSRALGRTSKSEQAQNESKQSAQTNTTEPQNRPVKSRKTNSRYLGVINKHQTSPTSTGANNPRTQTQSFQSAFKNADWGTATDNNRSVQQSGKVDTTANSNRSAQQDQRLAATAKSRHPVKQNRQVTTSTKKPKWKNFFKKLGQVAGEIARGLNQSNSYASQSNNRSYSTTELHLYGGDGHDQYLGCYDCKRYNPNAICSKYGSYGSKYSSESIFNKYGTWGSKYNSSSPWNKYSSSNSVPVLVDKTGGFYGYFTINRYRSNAVDFSSTLRELYESASGDLEVVRDVICENR